MIVKIIQRGGSIKYVKTVDVLVEPLNNCIYLTNSVGKTVIVFKDTTSFNAAYNKINTAIENTLPNVTFDQDRNNISKITSYELKYSHERS